MHGQAQKPFDWIPEVNMHKTLPRCFINTNMCEGQANEYLGLDDDYFVPSIHLYYKDDLTEG